MFDLGKSNIFERRRGHPPRTYTNEEGRGQAKCVRLRTRSRGGAQGYVRTQKKINILDHKISKLFFFCTKKAIALPFIVYRKV